MPGSLPGNQTVTLLAINYPELSHCFPFFIKPWTIFLPPVINSSHDDALHPMNQHKREIQASGIDDKQWQGYLRRTFNWKQVSYKKKKKMNSKVKGLSYILLGQKILQLPVAVHWSISIHEVKTGFLIPNLFSHNISLWFLVSMVMTKVLPASSV